MATDNNIGPYDFVIGAPENQRHLFNGKIKELLLVDSFIMEYKRKVDNSTDMKQKMLRKFFEGLLKGEAEGGKGIKVFQFCNAVYVPIDTSSVDVFPAFKDYCQKQISQHTQSMLQSSTEDGDARRKPHKSHKRNHDISIAVPNKKQVNFFSTSGTRVNPTLEMMYIAMGLSKVLCNTSKQEMIGLKHLDLNLKWKFCQGCNVAVDIMGVVIEEVITHLMMYVSIILCCFTCFSPSETVTTDTTN
jgi:hypothetical protein